MPPPARDASDDRRRPVDEAHAAAPWRSAQRIACHSGENSAKGKKPAWPGSSVGIGSKATGGVMPGAAA